ncbi:MAG TPA: putative cytokinetic ring protein SteA [Streptosporangiaceae bacterium]|nr:putative cytokinetic ring protein SteA [Streptosporangiaceae bacterium]
MKSPSRLLPWARRGKSEDLPAVIGTARLDRMTKNLTKRLCPGDVAIIDHRDLDRVSADALISCQVAAVINASPSISGRYPNMGPHMLVEAGIPLVDNVGPDIFARVSEGQTVWLDGDALYRADEIIAKGALQTPESVAEAETEAKAGLSTQLEAFVANTMEYLKRERELLIEGAGVPELRTKLQGRHVLVVVRGYHYREDLAVLRGYIREYKPIMIGVDGGADALLEAGHHPDIIVGDMDSISDKALGCGAELVVHAYPDGRAPGLARVQELGMASTQFPAAGTSEDVALLLAYEKGASLIVAVGTRFSLVEFLDKGRSGAASTFLTRLRVGGTLVEPKGVSQLYRSRISGWSLVVLVLAAVATIAVAIVFSPAGPILLRYLGSKWDGFVYWLTGLF